MQRYSHGAEAAIRLLVPVGQWQLRQQEVAANVQSGQVACVLSMQVGAVVCVAGWGLGLLSALFFVTHQRS